MTQDLKAAMESLRNVEVKYRRLRRECEIAFQDVVNARCHVRQLTCVGHEAVEIVYKDIEKEVENG